MLKSKVLLIGAGGHAASCIEIIEAENKNKIIGLIGTPKEVGKKLLGYEVIGSEKDFVDLQLELLPNEYKKLWQQQQAEAVQPQPRIREI